MSIEVKNITKIYGEQKALDDVSFNVETGKIVGFLGPNGAGKSTMMKILTGFIPQTSGTASVNGYDVNTQIMEVRRSVGYLPENNPLYLDMYVKEYLHFVAGMHGIKNNVDTLVQKMIDITGLGIEQRKKIGILSKGYKQRVGLAQALIHNPSVLILDEPTGGLDPNQLADIRKLIIDLGKEKTVMLSTHIMQEVQAMCQQVIIIDRGKIKANKPTDKLHTVLEINKEVVEVEFEKPVLEKDLLSITGVLTATSKTEQVWWIESSAEKDVRAALFKWAVEKNNAVLTLKKMEKTLEEIFQEVTQNK
jgi:ABC-2 type transport system ATP-binding protein